MDVPNDPRASPLVPQQTQNPARRTCAPQSRTVGDAITLDVAGCFVDVVEIARATQEGIEALEPSRLKLLSTLFAGDFWTVSRSTATRSSMAGSLQRRRFRVCHAAILEHLVRNLPSTSEEVFGYLETWPNSPHSTGPRTKACWRLAQHRRIREGDEHLAATGRLFEAEGLD